MSQQSEFFSSPRLSLRRLLCALLITAATGIAGHAPALSAQTNERPFLVEFNFSPAFIAVAGNSLTDESVDELVVDSWKPGITIGYLVLDRLAVSYSWLPGLDLTLRESWGFTGAGDVDIELPHQTGDVHGVDVRLVPFGGGFQIGASYLRVQASTYRMDAVRTGPQLALGNGSYPTDATAEWVTESYVVEARGEVATFLSPGGGNPTLATRVGGKHLWGAFPYYEAAFVGGTENVRGLREDRYAGRSSHYGSAELRVSLGRFPLLFPAQFGAFGFGDIGRVFDDAIPSDKWHNGYGGGIWLAPISRATTFQISVARTEERTAFYFGMGFAY